MASRLAVCTPSGPASTTSSLKPFARSTSRNAAKPLTTSHCRNSAMRNQWHRPSEILAPYSRPLSLLHSCTVQPSECKLKGYLVISRRNLSSAPASNTPCSAPESIDANSLCTSSKCPNCNRAAASSGWLQQSAPPPCRSPPRGSMALEDDVASSAALSGVSAVSLPACVLSSRSLCRPCLSTGAAIARWWWFVRGRRPDALLSSQLQKQLMGPIFSAQAGSTSSMRPLEDLPLGVRFAALQCVTWHWRRQEKRGT
mmetsp:Transcript_89511/g.252162  ORF Transcript_89511/g.252162 Transcript_89511/m.252162 type:complete len:256 (+) Transcript_89511:573-1340(+)